MILNCPTVSVMSAILDYCVLNAQVLGLVHWSQQLGVDRAIKAIAPYRKFNLCMFRKLSMLPIKTKQAWVGSSLRNVLWRRVLVYLS